MLHEGLPSGEIRWGLLVMDKNGRFQIDNELVDNHAKEMRRQLDATSSIFNWAQVFNRYMAFVVQNCGQPARVYGKAHVDGIIDAVARMQVALFSSESNGGNFVDAAAKLLESKFGVRASEIPMGWYLWPNAVGGLELKDPFIDLMVICDGFRIRESFEAFNNGEAGFEKSPEDLIDAR